MTDRRHAEAQHAQAWQCWGACTLAHSPAAPRPAHRAGGHAAVATALLAAHADPDVQNSNGNTPLHLACGKGWQVGTGGGGGGGPC